MEELGKLGWSIFKWDPVTTSKILSSYASYIRDSIGVMGFLEELSRNTVLVHEKGWLALEAKQPDASCIEVHGAKWSRESVNSEVSELLKSVKDAIGTHCFIGRVPDHAGSAARLLEGAGFVKTGYVPLDASYQGRPQGTNIYTLFMNGKEASK